MTPHIAGRAIPHGFSTVCAHGRRWNVAGHPVDHPRYRWSQGSSYSVGLPPPGVPDKLSNKTWRCPCRALGLA